MADAISLPACDTPVHEDAAAMTPVRERTTDGVAVSRLRLTIAEVVMVVSTALAVSSAQYIFQSGEREARATMQSDIRDIRTRMEMQRDIDAAEQQTRTAEAHTRSIEMKAQGESIAELRRLVQMLQLQYQEMAKVRR